MLRLEVIRSLKTLKYLLFLCRQLDHPFLCVDPILQHLRGLEQEHFYLACSKFGILTTAYFCPGFHRATEQLRSFLEFFFSVCIKPQNDILIFGTDKSGKRLYLFTASAITPF